MAEWFTPRQIALARQIRVGKVLAWIRSGQLQAVNYAERSGGRPRWRVSSDSLAAFERSRTNFVAPPPKRQAPRSAGRSEVIEFF